MVVIPIALLCYLSFRAGFNYLVKDNYRLCHPLLIPLSGITARRVVSTG